MGNSADYLIDMGLNIAGFLAAGLLAALVYSLIADRGKKRKSAAVAATPAPLAAPPSPRSRLAEDVGNIEYIDLRKAGVVAGIADQVYHPRGEYKVRDRQEIIQQAKKMISGKKSSSGRTMTLPLTEAELAFMRQNFTIKESARS
jgi:hypothetical protein